MKFNINITIFNPVDKKVKRELKYVAVFTKTENNYGNGYYLHIESREGKQYFEQNFDLRYDTSFNSEFAEVYLATWVYKNWTGKNGSYDVADLRIWRTTR